MKTLNTKYARKVAIHSQVVRAMRTFTTFCGQPAIHKGQFRSITRPRTSFEDFPSERHQQRKTHIMRMIFGSSHTARPRYVAAADRGKNSTYLKWIPWMGLFASSSLVLSQAFDFSSWAQWFPRQWQRARDKVLTYKEDDLTRKEQRFLDSVLED